MVEILRGLRAKTVNMNTGMQESQRMAERIYLTLEENIVHIFTTKQIRQMVVNVFIGMTSITAIRWLMNWIFSTPMWLELYVNMIISKIIR